MNARTDPEGRLLATVALVDLALVLDRAGIDARSFSTAELHALDRLLLRRTPAVGPSQAS